MTFDKAIAEFSKGHIKQDNDVFQQLEFVKNQWGRFTLWLIEEQERKGHRQTPYQSFTDGWNQALDKVNEKLTGDSNKSGVETVINNLKRVKY